MFFFNNCIGRCHAVIYRNEGAFYDLETKGVQSRMATDLQPGDWCVVMSRATGDRLSFTRFSFLREETKADEHGIPQRVLIGKPVTSELLSKKDAARSPIYSVFFDRNGNFKRRSVLHR